MFRHRTIGPITPPVSVILFTFRFDPVSAAAIAVALALYIVGIVTVVRRGGRWRVLPTLAFVLLGLGSFAAIQFGFLGTYSHDLRFAFTTRIALLLFAVPALMALGRPVDLARQALTGRRLELLEGFFRSVFMKVVGSAIFSPLFGLALFTVFITPLAFPWRASETGQILVTLLVPLIGLLMILPVFDSSLHHTSFYITVEFMLAFVELILDAIPGIVLRITGHVLDHGHSIAAVVQPWYPTQLRDQQLSGDLLWFIAELADIPVLIFLFVRWSRTDKKEAKVLDEMSDEEMERLTQEHLRSFGR
ncbi:cytochrome c oxidase assembly protein [Frondihabitans australicus]|uniref:Cytochrome c oxidase assembly factor CtaG n=1 Tax=Frondihabitans australicus TaxID=386892 RepID=A0A495IM32_9MICO|nr:cytochrome c oxidase assembly protein [Frondihabitans australicus]RKR76185.1 cytochrome c oxidase assembly factor CtaG [Frondihabitans australicus]